METTTRGGSTQGRDISDVDGYRCAVCSLLFFIRIVAHSLKYLEITAINGHLTPFTPWSSQAVPRRLRLLYFLVLVPF